MSDSGYSFRSGGLPGIIFTILVMIALFYIAKGFFIVLYWLSPFLLIATLVLDYQVVIKYIKMIWSLLLRNPIGGLLAIALSVLGYPIVIFFLFGRAWFGHKVRKQQQQEGGYRRQSHYSTHSSDEFVAYEEITDEDSEAISGLFEINRNEPPKQEQHDQRP